MSDLPSAGDTSYAGGARRAGQLYVSDYSSDIRRDYPWVIGMLSASDIWLARIDVAALLAVAARRPRPAARGLPPAACRPIGGQTPSFS